MKNTIAIIFGIAVAIFIGSIFMDVSNQEQIEYVNEIKEIKGFQIGSFKNYENALVESKKRDSIIVKDEDNFNVYIAILEDQNLQERMINYLNSNNVYFYLKSLNPTPEFQEELYKLETMMKETTSDVAFLKLNKKILEKYGDINES